MNKEKRVTTCASALLACGDSVFFGLSLCGVASGNNYKSLNIVFLKIKIFRSNCS